jgi:hypothetical protein
MEIKTINDWFEVELELTRQIRGVGYNSDLAKMKRNLDDMVRELSKSEVEARRTKNYRYIQPQIDAVNKSIESLEMWILMLVLER